jgi:hypothetical protein
VAPTCEFARTKAWEPWLALEIAKSIGRWISGPGEDDLGNETVDRVSKCK